MRITGTLHSIGAHHFINGLPEDRGLSEVEIHGILITADDETLRAASNLLCATVDIYPHPVNGLVAGECTPENYAHALARLAHAEEVAPTADHLAREVRSSQALAAALSDLEALLVKQEADHAARDAAWAEYLDLRKQTRKAAAEGRTDSEEQRTLALDLARIHNFDPPTRALEEAQARIAELTQLLAIAEGSAAKYEQKYIEASRKDKT